MPVDDVYWLAATPAPVRPPLAGDTRADVLVVGAGFTGLWAAVQLLERDPGRSVLVCEAESVGSSASGRNGGFLDPSLTHGLANGLRHFPDEIGRLERLAAANYTGFREALDRYAVDCDFEPVGMLEVATAHWQVGELREWADLHAAHGHDVEWLDVDAARERLRSPLVRAAVRRPSDGGVLDPAKLVRGLARAAESLGARIVERTPVRRLRRFGAGAVAQTPQGRVHADVVLVATNAHTGSVLRRTRRHYVPVYDYVLVTEPLPGDALAGIGWKSREGVSDAGNQFHYFRLTADDRILWGGYDAVYHPGNGVGPRHDRRPETHERLAAHFRAFFPTLADVRFTHRWGGPIAATTRFTPAFGSALGGRVHYALGYTGLGVAASRFAARVLVDRVLDPGSELLSLDYVTRAPFPFPPEPARTVAVAATRRAIARADAHEGRRGPWLALLDRFGVGFDS